MLWAISRCQGKTPFPSCLANLLKSQWAHWCTPFSSLLLLRRRYVFSSEWWPRGFLAKEKCLREQASTQKRLLSNRFRAICWTVWQNWTSARPWTELTCEHPLSLLWSGWVTSQSPWEQLISKLPPSFSESVLKERPFCLCPSRSFSQGPHLAMWFLSLNSPTYSLLAAPLSRSRRSSFHLHPKGSGWAAVAAQERTISWLVPVRRLELAMGPGWAFF